MNTLLPMLALLSSLAHAAEDRGSRTVQEASLDLDGDKKADSVLLREHAADDGNLRLEIKTAAGLEASSDNLIAAIDRDEEDPSSYNVSIEQKKKNQIKIRSTKDWGLKMWRYEYTITNAGGKLELDHFTYSYTNGGESGECDLNLHGGAAVVNLKLHRLQPIEHSLERADGLDLLKVCQDLGAK